jgi:hypothetical protein
MVLRLRGMNHTCTSSKMHVLRTRQSLFYTQRERVAWVDLKLASNADDFGRGLRTWTNCYKNTLGKGRDERSILRGFAPASSLPHRLRCSAPQAQSSACLLREMLHRAR